MTSKFLCEHKFLERLLNGFQKFLERLLKGSSKIYVNIKNIKLVSK